MNVHEALAVVTKTVHLAGRSDHGLANEVNALAGPSGGGLAPACGLDCGVTLRAIDVLHRLATATRPKYQPDVFDVYSHWALLRYLGIFDLDWTGNRYTLSDAGRRVVGNQRKVLSEELGIGFSVMLAEAWQHARMPISPTPRVVDIDVALTNRRVSFAGFGAGKTVRSIGPRRPDYILLTDDSSILGRFRVAMLECKGTKSQRTSRNQLARASLQLQGVEVAGRVPVGLATSTVIGDTSISFNALQLDHGLGATGSGDGPSASAEPETSDSSVQLDVSELSHPLEIDLESDRDLSLRELAGATLQASWATLGDLSGNDRAFDRWATPQLHRKLQRNFGSERSRRNVETPDQRGLIGTSNVLAMPGGALEVFLGVDAEVDEALSTGRPDHVLEAQQSVRFRNWTTRQRNDRPSEGVAVALADDGSALMLRAL